LQAVLPDDGDALSRLGAGMLSKSATGQYIGQYRRNLRSV